MCQVLVDGLLRSGLCARIVLHAKGPQKFWSPLFNTGVLLLI